MKMEGGDILKLSSSTKTPDTGLTFGPAWLRQLSSGDTNKTALPPSPGLAFQLSKHRYSREEMLAIYETIEKTLSQQHPPNLATDFEDLFRKDVQRPVLLTALSSEEQKFLSTCVNSQVVLNSYNKIQGGHAGASDRQSSSQSSSNHSSNNSASAGGNGVGDRERGGLERGSSRGGGSGRGSRGGGGGGTAGGNREAGSREAGGFGRGQSGAGGTMGDRLGSDRERTGGRGRGRGRGSESQSFKTIEEEPSSSKTGGAGAGLKGPYVKGSGGSFNRGAHNSNWEEGSGGGAGPGGAGGAAVKKEYSRAMTDENWRNRPSGDDEQKVSTSSSDEVPTSSAGEGSKSTAKANDAGSKAEGDLSKSASRTNNWRNDKSNGAGGKDAKEASNANSSSNSSSSSREWTVSGAKKHSNQSNNNNDSSNNNRSKSNTNANDNIRKNDRHPEWLNDDDEEMTFDDRGQFIPVKELKNKKAAEKPAGAAPSAKTESAAPTSATSNASKPSGDEAPKPKEEAVEKAKPPSPPEENPPAKVEESKPSNDTSQYDSKKSQINEDINKLIKAEQAMAAKQQASGAIDQNALLMNQFSAMKNFPATAQGAADPSLQMAMGAASFADVAQNMNNLLAQQQAGPGQVEADPKTGSVPLNHPDAYMWFYMDPQNQIQGAFSAEQMLGWFQAGYFALSLMVKRGCDDKFLPLAVVTSNWGRIPFTPGPQPQPLLAQPPQPKQGIWSKEQVLQQMQMFQQLQQIPYFPQNFNMIRNELNQMQSSNTSMAPLGNLLQQLQQLQLQQNNVAAATSNIGQVQQLNELRIQQEALINQLLVKNNLSNMQKLQQQHQAQPMADSVADIDPAILGAAPAQMQNDGKLPVSSVWGDVSRISPLGAQQPVVTPPIAISPLNNLATGSTQNLANLDPAAVLAQQLAATSLSNMQMLNENSIKDKLQALFEQTKREEEKRRRMEEEYQLKLKREEEEKKRAQEDLRMKEEEMKRMEEERLRKEQQKKKLDELIKAEEEERRRNEEALKKRKEEESKLKQEKLKQKQQQKEEQQKKLEQQAQQQQELEKQKQQQLLLQQQQQAAEQLKKQQAAAAAEQQKLNNLQLPAHANWGKGGQQQQQQQQQQLQLKAILEQQALESMQQRILEQQKQAELQASQQQSQGSSWSSLFRGTQQAALASSSATGLSNAPQPLSLASIQAEQAKLDTNTAKQGPVTLSQKLQNSAQPAPAAPLTMAAKIAASSTAPTQQPAAQANTSSGNKQQSWASWTQAAPAGKPAAAPAPSSNNDGGFWTDIGDKKSSGKAASQNAKGGGGAKNAQFPDLNPSGNSHNNGKQHRESGKEKKSHIQAVEENVQQTFLSNMTISDEFMKWCHEQLKDFHVELHVPTFVNFLREIETCEDIENYVVDYLGDSKNAKEFAQQFYINRESQLKEQANDDQDDMNYNSGSNSKQSNRQKKRSKGQRVDHQLLGFTVQPDPNLKNRGNIDPL